MFLFCFPDSLSTSSTALKSVFLGIENYRDNAPIKYRIAQGHKDVVLGTSTGSSTPSTTLVHSLVT